MSVSAEDYRNITTADDLPVEAKMFGTRFDIADHGSMSRTIIFQNLTAVKKPEIINQNKSA